MMFFLKLFRGRHAFMESPNHSKDGARNWDHFFTKKDLLLSSHYLLWVGVWSIGLGVFLVLMMMNPLVYELRFISAAGAACILIGTVGILRNHRASTHFHLRKKGKKNVGA